MRLAQILFSQGFGSRRLCAGLIADGRVAVAGQVVHDPGAEFDTDGLVFEVEGRAWPFHAKALVLLHKPAGFECSQKPRHHPSVMSLLPPPLRDRGVQPVGRLDEDTTGVLLLTDDGALIHRLTSPRHHVPEVNLDSDQGHSGNTQQQCVGDVAELDTERVWITIEVKNRFETGDRLELITPAGNRTFTLNHLENLRGETITAAPGSGHRVRFPLPEGGLGNDGSEFALLMRHLPGAPPVAAK